MPHITPARATSLLITTAVVGGLAATLPTTAHADQNVNIAIVGDSFTSGNGVGSYTDELDCYQSTKNFGHVLASSLQRKGHSVNVKDYSCSGSKWRHIASSRYRSSKQTRTVPSSVAGNKAATKKHLEKAGACKAGTPGQTKTSSVKVTGFSGNTAKYSCSGSIKPMAQAANANTDIVVLTMGLNDIGYGALVKGCMLDGTSTAQCNSAVKTGAGKVNALKDHTSKGLSNLYSQGMLGKNTRVVLVGVPMLATDSTAKGQALRGLSNKINDAQIAGVKAFNAKSGHNVTYLDTRGLFAGHEVDLREGKTNPSGWVTDHGQPGNRKAEWFHPNRVGHAKIGAKLASMNLASGPVAKPQPEPTPEPTATVEPVTPEPVTPEPVEPTPVKPEPVTPEPVTPEPVKPEPVEPTPVQPEPVPVTPEPTTPTSEPTNDKPQPVQPEPADPTVSLPVEPTPISDPEPVKPVDPIQPVNPKPTKTTPTAIPTMKPVPDVTVEPGTPTTTMVPVMPAPEPSEGDSDDEEWDVISFAWTWLYNQFMQWIAAFGI